MTGRGAAFEGRRLLSRRGLWGLGTLCLLCAFVFLIFARLPKGTVAVVEKNGKELLRRELSQLTGPEETEIQGENGIWLELAFYPDGAAVLSSQCPDKICVGHGKLTKAGETAVCLPARVSLRLEGPGADGVTY